MTWQAGFLQKVFRMTAGRSWAFALWSALTIFVSAFLLFQVQPMVSKMILPWFGGSPAVWSTCMLFFQIILLAGYGYAHVTSTWLSPRKQVILHGVLLLLAIISLPITPGDAWRPEDGKYPSLRILLVLTMSVGLPYFLVSSTGPLVQAWYARVYAGSSPYRLYALSNVGSLGALVSYPFFFEPKFTLPQQDAGWSWGFGLFALLNGIMAAYLWKFTDAAHAEPVVEETPTATNNAKAVVPVETSFYTKVIWVFLPALASVALLAITNHLSQDVAAVPFLWVLPLSLYLITFILCFDSDRWYQRWLFAPAAMLSVLWFCFLGMIPTLDTLCEKLNRRITETHAEQQKELDVAAFPDAATELEAPKKWPIPSETLDQGMNYLADKVNFLSKQIIKRELLPKFEYDGLSHDPTYQGIFYLTFLFLGCMVCHGELARLKPSGRGLTEYYLMISAGGALGGVFVALICPRIFTWYMELPLSLAGVFLVGGVTIALLVGSQLNVSRLLRFSLAAAGLSAVGAISGNSLGQSLSQWTHLEWLAWCVPLLLAAIGSLLAWAIVATTQKEWQVFCGGLGGLFILAALFGVVINGTVKKTDASQLAAERSFYGALQVKNDSVLSPTYRWLTHGRISHGYQLLDEDKKNTPNSYYAPHSGIGVAIQQHPRAGKLRVGVVGLGTGTIAAYGQAGETYRFYEIDELVIRFSDQYFTYRQDTPAKTEVILGDARIQMERESPQQYDVIAVDAFSGDAIPVHLLTREAMEVYRKHLQPDGILAVHISNRYLDLLPVVRGMAEQAHMQLGRVDYSPTDEERTDYKMTESEWVLVSNNTEFWSREEVRSSLEPADDQDPEHPPRTILWTDDYSNLFEIFQ
jgi:spermidine synthase